MGKMIKKKSKSLTTFCLTQGDWLFLRAHYGWSYMAQVMIKNPKKDIPKLIKALKKGLREFKEAEIEAEIDVQNDPK